MRVRELIEELNKLDPELPVISARDPEGNGYHHIQGVDDYSVLPAEITEQHYLEGFINTDYSPEENDLTPEEFDEVVSSGQRFATVYC